MALSVRSPCYGHSIERKLSVRWWTIVCVKYASLYLLKDAYIDVKVAYVRMHVHDRQRDQP
jgi:hypothetical protein